MINRENLETTKSKEKRLSINLLYNYNNWSQSLGVHDLDYFFDKLICLRHTVVFQLEMSFLHCQYLTCLLKLA